MGHKILLADDSITIQKVIELTFSDEDFELHTVGNGQKAIDEIRSIMPDVVLCDIIMPEKNGYEVCEFIKSSADLQHIPVLLLTGAFEPFDQERAKAAGCEGFLAKPFEPQTLISRVKELLENAAQAPAAPASAPAPAPAAPAPASAAPPPQAASFDAQESDATVLVPPPAAASAPPPASGPQVTPNAPPPPAEAPAPAPAAADEGFAVEAGERELAMGPTDHTVLLGAQETSSSSSAPASSSDDDVWGQVASPSEEDEASTVFMAAPPPIAEAPPQEEKREPSDPDATWQMPDSTPSSSAPDAPGFQEFASPEPSPSTPPPPPAAQDHFEPVFEADPDPDPAPAPAAEPTATFEPIEAQSFQEFEAEPSSSRTDATIDPVMSSESFEPVVASEPEPAPSPAPTPAPAAPTPTPAPAKAQSAASNPHGASGVDGVDEELVEKIAQRVVDKLSAKVVQEIAWEVVPDLAEGMIAKEIEALKAKIPK